MQLQNGEVTAVKNSMGAQASQIANPSWAVLQRFESQPVGVMMPGAETTSGLSSADIQAFGQALINYRTADMMGTLRAPPPPSPQSSPSTAAGAPPPPASPAGAVTRVAASGRVVRTAASAAIAPSPSARVQVRPPAVQAVQASTVQSSTIATVSASQVALKSSLLTFAKAAVQNFTQAIQISPIGRLHLERIEMTPAGIERGELLATVPLAPQETASVMQKEWATTSDEFSSIVTDYLEQVSEKGVTEKSELAQSSEAQTKHDNQIDLSASVSGKYGFVSFAANSSLKLADSISNSEKVSRNHTVETTRKAATRSRKERKVTIETTSVKGTEEVTTRTLTNPSTTAPLRIDYYSMMRKWHVKLYRYGLRMTYDIAIPEPGAALRESLADLADLNEQITNVFTFNLDPASIDRTNWQSLANEYGATLDPPPNATWNGHFTVQPLQASGDQNGAQTQTLSITVIDGYEIGEVSVGGWASPFQTDLNSPVIVQVAFGTDEAHIMKTIHLKHIEDTGQLHDLTNDPGQGDDNMISNAPAEITFPSLVGLSGQVNIPFITSYAGSGLIFADVAGTLSADAWASWQQKSWATLRQAASDAFYLGQQSLVAQRDTLEAQIAGVDTLTLRQEEMQEVMKGVLRWLLGPAFDFMPPDVQSLFGSGTGISFTSNELGLDPTGWTTMFTYQEMVKFLQQAIEWENLLYFLYPYFWDVPSAWDFVRNLQHPDLTRQSFVRSGSARVVITIRPGFEDAFSSFIEQGQLGQILPPDHPYLTIAQEIEAYNETNYPGIPPANPDAVPVNSQDAAVTASSSKVDASTSPVTLTVDTTDGFQTGMTVTIDTYDSDVQEAETISAIPDATHLQVSQLKYAHDGTSTPFPIVQPGEAGVVIAEWYEYTPSHGTDIALATPLPEMD